ncbi:MAG: nitrous oxide reductase family maturation protein NosD [Saprospiraceae bacterium]|nr:nitrous oxide reductase family maturation protein NosD [Saprospiraceae bacterium]MBK8371264.1 nitrous oxide reductase family maturation protein NosD [Saprospiraceae bacterium]MBK8853873.1 nitrous oxide reductase family maturation protein NosD [Saprospiraceae bacterium]
MRCLTGLLIPLFIFVAIPCFVSAKNIHIGPGKEFRSIRPALLKAVDGDSVFVHHSLYKEGNIIINKKIVMIGVNNPIIDGDKKYEVVSIRSDHVVFRGFTVQNSGYGTLNDLGGIKVYDAQHIVIENNILDNNFFSIYINFGKNILIKNNIIKAYGVEEQQIGNGIHCWKSDSLQIIGNYVQGHRDGIYFEFVTNSIIWRNISKYNIRYGLHFMFSNDDAYINNVFDNNGSGVAVMYTKKVVMYNNTFKNSLGDASYGILLKEISDAEIIGNHFIHNTAGLFLEGANRIIIQKNNFLNNGWGLKIQANCMDNKISVNNFIGNTFDVSTNGSLVLNIFEKNYWDKYEGYDLDKNHLGDVPYHPLNIYSTIIENNPIAMLLFRSFMVTLLERTEKLIPSITPDNFKDENPVLKAYLL